jgi:cholesterol transport system auxiliary component
MTAKHYGYICLLFFYLLALNLGCVSLQKNYPERKYYVFDVRPPNNYNRSPLQAVLEIRNFRVSPAYNGHEFVYRVSGDGYESDFYNQFFKSPALLIAQEAFRWFSQINMFEYTVMAPSETTADYVLNGYVNSIYGDYIDGVSPKAVLAMQFFLIKEDFGKDTIVFSKSYDKDVGIASKSPTALVNGWNEALREVLVDLESDLTRLDLRSAN